MYIFFPRLKYFIYQLIMFAHKCSKFDACVCFLLSIWLKVARFKGVYVSEMLHRQFCVIL